MLQITIPAGGAALSMGAMAMTNVGWEPEVPAVAETAKVMAEVDVTAVEGGSKKAVVGNDAIVVVGVSDFEDFICSTSIGGARGNGALNSG
uniref:Secreted protein n=1 Tax=Romanomermis culicivorax TaxID=13658 RepID=A0A915HY36_ROMCU